MEYTALTLQMLFCVFIIVNYATLICLGDRKYAHLMLSEKEKKQQKQISGDLTAEEIERLKQWRQPLLCDIFHEMREVYYHPDRFHVIKNHGHFVNEY